MTKKCKSCQTDIDVKAKKCPNCRADQRNWAARHPILTGLGVLIILIIVLSIIGSSNKGGNTSSSTPSNGSNSTANTNQPTQAAKTANIGDTVNSDNNLAFTVTKVDTAQTLGGSVDAKKAQGMYYIISVKIQNNGKSTQTINASEFNIVDSQGRKYDYSTDGQTAMEMSQGTTDLFLQQIQPSLSVTGNLVFDVPASATGLKLLVQGDLFSQGQEISLGK